MVRLQQMKKKKNLVPLLGGNFSVSVLVLLVLAVVLADGSDSMIQTH